MSEAKSSKHSSLSLLNLLKLGIFDPIYAKTCSSPDEKATTPKKEAGIPVRACPPKPDKDAGGDCPPPAPPPRKCACRSSETTKGTASNRGKTGAGVTGSRTECSVNDADELPASATHPGLLRHLHNAARNLLPQCFEGASVSLKQSSSNNWMLGHSLSFSSVSPGGYKLLLSYADKNKPAALPYFVMEAAPGGQMSCEFRVAPTTTTRAASVAQVADGQFYSFESIVDAYFPKTTASVIAVNRDFIALHYLQAITKRVSLGAEVVARGHLVELSSASGAGRWANESHSVSGTLGSRGLDLCYSRVITPYLSAAAMLEVGFAIRRSVATLAYEWRSDNWTVRGSADSDGLVGATLQRALGGNRAQLSYAMSALLNHPNDKFRLGFGITASII